MALKRLMLAALVATLAIAPGAYADAPDDPVCAANHITGDDCQGPDWVPSDDKVIAVGNFVANLDLPKLVGELTTPPDGCRIGVWVGKVTCSGLLPHDGAGTTINGGVTAYNDVGKTATLTVRIIDEVTSVVLKEDTASSNTIVNTPVGPVTWVSIGYASFYGYSFGHPVTIEAEGTHAELGAQTAAIAALDPGAHTYLAPRLPNNRFDLRIN